MKVFTHYPALAPAIQRAGYETVLLEPLVLEPGPVTVEVVEGIDPRAPKSVVVAERGSSRPIYLETMKE